MRVQVIPVTLSLPLSVHPRTVGIHHSGIIRNIAIEMGILKTDEAEALSLVDVRAITDPIAITRMCIGLAWEQWYVPTLASEGVLDHPGEMEMDGIYMTPDGESVSVVRSFSYQTALGLVPRIHEIKATYKGLNTVGMGTPERVYDTETDAACPLAGEWLWKKQLQGYCYAKGATGADLHVLFLNGYGISMPAVFRYAVEFTQRELESHWAMVTQYRDDALAKGMSS